MSCHNDKSILRFTLLDLNKMQDVALHRVLHFLQCSRSRLNPDYLENLLKSVHTSFRYLEKSNIGRKSKLFILWFMIWINVKSQQDLLCPIGQVRWKFHGHQRVNTLSSPANASMYKNWNMTQVIISLEQKIMQYYYSNNSKTVTGRSVTRTWQRSRRWPAFHCAAPCHWNLYHLESSRCDWTTWRRSCESMTLALVEPR